VAPVPIDDDTLDRFVVARYAPRGRAPEPEDLEVFAVFDSFDEAEALRQELKRSSLTEHDRRGDGPGNFVYTVQVIEKGSVTRDRSSDRWLATWEDGDPQGAERDDPSGSSA
jgi:hypothetical protein